MSEAAEYLADLRAELAVGEEIIIRRYSGSSTPRSKTEAKVRARVKGAGSTALVGSAITQSKFTIVAINDPQATVETGFVALSALLPLSYTDRVVIAGRELGLETIDEFTRRIAGTTIGVDLVAVG